MVRAAADQMYGETPSVVGMRDNTEHIYGLMCTSHASSSVGAATDTFPARQNGHVTDQHRSTHAHRFASSWV